MGENVLTNEAVKLVPQCRVGHTSSIFFRFLSDKCNDLMQRPINITPKTIWSKMLTVLIDSVRKKLFQLGLKF